MLLLPARMWAIPSDYKFVHFFVNKRVSQMEIDIDDLKEVFKALLKLANSLYKTIGDR